jgi:hypothetical protein
VEEKSLAGSPAHDDGWNSHEVPLCMNTAAVT